RPSWISARRGARRDDRAARRVRCGAPARPSRPWALHAERGPSAVPLVIEVAAALIRDSAGRYLITQRRRGSHLAGLWEFPGGKRDAGEALESCLARELTEELGARFTVGERVDTVRWEYPDRTVVIHFYRCGLA